MPKLPTNLARIGAVYKFRARVPNDLLDHYAPKKEIVESLKTKDLAEARRRLVNVQQRYHNEWERLRQNQFESQLLDAPGPTSRPAGVGTQTVLPLNQEAIEFACTFLENSSLSGDEQSRLANNYTLEEIEEYRERLPPAILFMAPSSQGLEPPPNPGRFTTISYPNLSCGRDLFYFLPPNHSAEYISCR